MASATTSYGKEGVLDDQPWNTWASPTTSDDEENVLEENDVDALLQAQSNRVKQEVMALIAPHMESTDKPPFSAGEMVVMACLCLGPDTVSSLETVQWVLEHFKHFQRKAIEYYAKVQVEQTLS